LEIDEIEARLLSDLGACAGLHLPLCGLDKQLNR